MKQNFGRKSEMAFDPFAPAFRLRIFRGVESYNPYKCTCKENTKLAANIVLTPDVRGLLKLPTMSQFFT